jgi:large subunit ribosomal protein L19e
MKIGPQKRLASQLLKCSEKKVWLDDERLDEVKEAITKADVKTLINKGLIGLVRTNGQSRVRARKRLEQRRKGRQKGPGTRKGKKTARLSDKERWIVRMRVQREFLKELKTKEIITVPTYRNLYCKSKGGFFRSKRHIKLYIDEHKLNQKK